MTDVISTLQSISVILASVITAGTVIYGISAWRREYVGKRKLELAEEVLALFYEARDAIRFIRNPVSFVGEGGTRNASPTEGPEEKQINDNAYVAFERYNKRRDLFNKLHAMRYRYMAQFGKDAAKPFDDLSKVVSDIFTSAHMLPHYWREQGHRQWKNDEEFRRHLDELHKYEAIFWEMTPDKDKIKPRVDSVISEIEAQAAKNLGKRR